MPRYEIVTHISIDVDGATPEEAAAVFRREILMSNGRALRSLAVWPAHAGPTPTPLPAPLQQQLIDFFAAVARQAAVEEEIFRTRVEEIFADDVATRENETGHQIDR
jgi:hypothetical protein